MAFPAPQLGLVLSYAYLWHREHQAGRAEGLKDRPCVIVMVLETAGDGTLVSVAPVTHSMPTNPMTAFELPLAVKTHLGLDSERSWVVLDEVNEFVWPGFDLRPVPGTRDRYTYGFLPPRLFASAMVKLSEVWRAKQGKATPRD